MRGNALVMIGLAVLCGTLAVLASRSWLDRQANQRLSEIEMSRVETPVSTIVVASEALRFGAPLTARVLREIPWAGDALPPGAFATVAELTAGEARSVLTPIEPNEPILAGKVTGPGQRGTLSAVIADGMRAVTVRVNDVAGVAGFVLPDDRVDVVLTRPLPGGEQVAEVLLQGIRVLAVDQLADQRSDAPTVAKAVTLEVDTRDAQKLTLASTVGGLSLILRRAGEAGAEVVQRVTLGDLSPASRIASLRPVMPDTPDADDPPAPAGPPQAVAPVNATIGVLRATERTEYEVPIETMR